MKSPTFFSDRKRILTPLLPPEETGDNKSEEQTTFTESEQNKEHTNDDDNAQTTEQTDTVVENSTYESNESQDNGTYLSYFQNLY